MKYQKITICVLMISVLLAVSGCRKDCAAVFSQNETSSLSQQEITDSKTVIGAECLNGLDTMSYDFSACLLEIYDENIIKTADVLYDGDEREQFAVTEYKISENAVFFQKSVKTTIFSKNTTSVTTEEYSVISREEFENMINSKTFLITANVWLDSNGSCSKFLIYGETTVWD